MATNVYETMFILDSNRYARDPNGVSGQIAELIQKLGGELLVSRLWNEQKLAYPINGQRKGTYWLTYFQVESTKLSEFNKQLQLNEAVLRSLTVKVEPRLVEPLVAHARGAKSMVKPPEPKPVAAAVPAMATEGEGDDDSGEEGKD